MYFEDKLQALLDNRFVKESAKGRYLAGFCIFPAQLYADFQYSLAKLYDPVGKELTDILSACEKEIRACGFYGCDFPFGRLLWILYAEAADVLSRAMAESHEQKWSAKIPPDNGKDYRVAGTVLYPDESFQRKDPGNTVVWSNLHSQFKTSRYGRVDYANLFQAEPFGDRDTIINETNADLVFRVFDDPALLMTPLEEEQAAALISKGYLEKRGGGLYLTMPVMTFDCQRRIQELLSAAVAPLAGRYAESVGSLGEKMLLPAVRPDLIEEFVHWVMLCAFCPVGNIFYYGMHSGALDLPDDYAASSAGICLYIRQ